MKKNTLLTLVSLLLTLFTAVPAYAGQCCTGGASCVGLMIGCALLWLVVSAVFLQYTWNLVIAELFHVKKGTFTQALLFVTTLAVLCVPKHMMMNHMRGGHMGCHEKGQMGDHEAEGDTTPAAPE